MDTLVLTNVLLIVIIVFLFAIYKDLNTRVVGLLKRLDIAVNSLKKFMVLNEEQKDEVRKMMIEEDKKIK
jgi:hypothetical protein